MNQNFSPEAEEQSADMLTATLTFKVAGKEESHFRQIPLPHPPANGGILALSAQTFSELEKEIRFSEFFDELPDPVSLHPLPRTYTPEEWFGEERTFLENTKTVWYEIVNTLLSARYLLAQSRAYKDVENSIQAEGADHRSPPVMNVHLSKMSAFDGAIYRLAKIEDLYLLLLFANLGNSLVETNLEAIDWQKKITWDAVKDGLKKRSPKAVSNRYLNSLSDQDYSTILSVFQEFKNPAEVGQITAYRDAVTHRLPPAVDYIGFSGVLTFLSGKQTEATIQVDRFVRKFTMDHHFGDLYSKAVKVFSHYVVLLSRLKTVHRFA